MPHPYLLRSLSLLLSLGLSAQDAPAPAAPAAAAPKGDELRRAFVDADGGKRLAIAAAADKLLAADKAGRAQFLTTLRAIAAVAPPPAAPAAGTPPPAAGTPQPPAAPAAKAPEFDDATKQLMVAAIGTDAAAQQASLAKLAADAATKPALAQLDERGKAILARCVTNFVRKQTETNAIYAGQYAELREFQPEAGALLLRWGKDAPRDGGPPEQFRTACVRALRDVLTTEQADDKVRAALKEIAGKAQSAGSQDAFITAICALAQFGDASLFDSVKEGVEKQAKSATEQQLLQATNMLADLHYQARKYEEAATHYKAFVALLEKAPQSQQGLSTIIYNACCSLALAGKLDEAMQHLEKALEVGVKSEQPLRKVLLDTDHDIASLRADPRFTALYEKYYGKAVKPAK